MLSSLILLVATILDDAGLFKKAEWMLQSWYTVLDTRSALVSFASLLWSVPGQMSLGNKSLALALQRISQTHICVSPKNPDLCLCAWALDQGLWVGEYAEWNVRGPWLGRRTGFLSVPRRCKPWLLPAVLVDNYSPTQRCAPFPRGDVCMQWVKWLSGPV